MSCSSDSDGVNTDPNDDVQRINPPEWIQGVWLADTWLNSGFEITDNSFCHISVCDKIYPEDRVINETTVVSYREEETDSTYFLFVIYADSAINAASTNRYKFERVSDSEIKIMDLAPIYTKQPDDWENCTLFDEEAIYPLNDEDAWLVFTVPGAPAQARVTLQIYYDDGTVETDESDPNRYISKSVRIRKEATRAVLSVQDRDHLSGINYDVIAWLHNSDYSKEYFVLYEEELRGLTRTIHFR